MKIKRYMATDMRSALAAVREEQGPDAVILSTRSTKHGVEVCAAIDVELATGQGTLAETAALKQLERDVLQELERDRADSSSPAPLKVEPGIADNAAQAVGLAETATASTAEHEIASLWAEAGRGYGSDASVSEELRSLRSLLEQQVAALAWNDFTRREPLKARALTDLAKLGLEGALAMQLVTGLPTGLSGEQLQRMPYALLSRRIQICAPPAQRSGALALIGPPGCGKTTTLAKLAARYVLEQDAANLLIISTDDERLGAHEQLRSLGRLLGVRVETAPDTAQLEARIAALPGRCILIDTPGIAGRDIAAAAHYRALRERCPQLTVMLVLPASAQAGVIDDAVGNFGAPLASCCTLTRIDEASSLGGTLSALVRSQLPVAYCAEGARIPEDLRPARAHQLVARAVELARCARCFPDDDLLARRYGGMAHVAA